MNGSEDPPSRALGPASRAGDTGARFAPPLIVTAASIEARSLLHRLGAPPPYRPPYLHVDPAAEASVLVAGVGRAGDDPFRRALVELDPGAVVNVGFAGALEDALAPGDVVAVERWAPGGDDPRPSPGGTDPDRRRPRTSDATLTRRLVDALERAGLSPRTVTAVTVDHPVGDEDARSRLTRRTGASVVEMEGGPWGDDARRRGIPFAAVRVVSDRANLSLPRRRDQLLTREGDIRWSRVAWALLSSRGLLHPIRGLRALRRAAADWRAACAALDGALDAVWRTTAATG